MKKETVSARQNKHASENEHKVETDDYNSGYDNQRNDYRSVKHKDKKDSSSQMTSEGNTHRSGKRKKQGNNNEDDKDSMHEG